MAIVAGEHILAVDEDRKRPAGLQKETPVARGTNIDMRGGIEDAVACEINRQLHLPIGKLKKLNLARAVARLPDLVTLRSPLPVEIDRWMESEGTDDSPVGQQP
jgi:hypothetical protein